MFKNPPESPNKRHDQNFFFQHALLGKQNLMQILLFYFLHCVIDVVVAILYMEHLKYTITKLAADIITSLLVLYFHGKLNQLHINIFLAVTKVTSLILILLMGYDLILIMVFILEINDIPEQKKEYLFQQTGMKICGLIVVIINSSILDIVIMLFALLLEICRLFLYYKQAKILQNEQFLSNSKTPREHQSFSIRESTWISKMQTLPIGIILFSVKDFKINFTNQICFQYFNQLCETMSELEELVLDKLNFQIVQYNGNEQKKIGTSQKISKSWAGQVQVAKNHESDKILITESKNALRSILSMYIEGRYIECINQLTNSLELYCQHNLDESTQSVYTGQVLINQEDNEIIVILLDITQYNNYQVESIQDQFKAQIVQSFSHELRTPLNSACNFLQCCLSDKSIQEATKHNLIEPAYNALRLQSHLINDIIDFSSLQAHEMEMDYKEFHIKDLIDEVNSLFKSSIEMKKLALYVDLFENSLKTLNTDFSRLMQIIVNILQNSVKYSSQGIIILKLTSFSSNYIKFTIKDQGIGINEERFSQIHKMLQFIEKKSDFLRYKTWHGFGLLVSQILLSKLCPRDFKSLLIRSEGRDQGTKVSFYIKNRKTTISQSSSSGYNRQNTLRQLSKIKASFQSVTNQMSLNGTLIQISDQLASNRKLNCQQWIKNATFKSNENSLYTDSYQIDEIDQKMGEINHVQPSLITDIAIKVKPLNHENPLMESPLYKSAREMQSAKVLSYQKIKLQDDFDSENLLKTFLKKRRCTCKRILSVDDEIFNQRSIQYLLSQQGFEIILAFNGEEAIKIVKEIERCGPTCNLFMLILMDYQMPIMDGIQTTKALRQLMNQHVIPQIHVIGLTAFNSKLDIQNCMEAGMSDVLAKPLKMKEFFEILNLL